MAIGDDDTADVVGNQGVDATAGGPGGGAPSGPPGGPPPGGGPIISALANQQRGPQVSAPGPGDTANSMTMIMQAVAMLQQALPGFPPGSPMHKDVLNAVSRLSRHASQGQPTAGIQQTQLQDMLRNSIRNALLQRIMSQGGPGGPGGPGGAGGGPMSTPVGGGQGGPQPGAPAPMPSTPMPGA